MDAAPLVADGLGFGYTSRSDRVIDDFSAELGPGVVHLLTGPSGSGKSTLLYLLATLLRPQAGTIRHGEFTLTGGHDAGRARWRAEHTGFVFQDALLDQSRTVLANVLEPAVFTGLDRADLTERARELMERFGVAVRPSARPGQISGGQAQRIGLCRALLRDPEVLFADEPTGNLDDDSGAVVWHALAEHAARGHLVIVATHHVDPPITFERLVLS